MTNFSELNSESEFSVRLSPDNSFDQGSNGVTFSGLNPVLGSLGVMIGLLKQSVEATDTYELVIEWFADPINNVKNGFNTNPKKLGELLGQLLGEIGGNALGVPQSNPAILGTWYPIQVKNNLGIYTPTGLYLVSIDNPPNPDVPNDEGSTALGLGVLKKWSIPVDTKAIDVDVWGLIPAVVINSKGFSLTFTDENNVNPISVGVAVEGSDPNNPIIQENGISFNGLKLSANLFLSQTPRFDVTFDVLALQLAGDSVPKNYSLADLEAITPQQIFETASNLFMGALSSPFDEATQKKIEYLAPLFGLSQSIPNNATTKLPILKWYDLFAIVSAKGDASKPFIDWFNTITSSPELLSGWMTCLSGFIGIPLADLVSSGDGSRNNPFEVPLLNIDKIGKLSFTAASVVVDNGMRYFYPGLAFAGSPIALGSSDAQFVMEADLELGKFQLSGTPEMEFDLNFKTNFKLQNKDQEEYLINYQGYQVKTMAGGVSLGLNAGSITPYLELTEVTVPGQSSPHDMGDTPANEFGTVNLLSPGELANVGAVALSGQLQSFMGLDNSPSVYATSIASLIGLTKPTSATNWPATLIPPFSVDGIANSITDPITALSDYYMQIINYQGDVDGEQAFTYILQSFASLLQIGDTSIEVTGSGTQALPWKVGISIGDKSMPAYLTAYTDNINDDPTNGFNLNLGLLFEPILTIESVKITPSLYIDALSLSFPTDKSLVAKWFNSVGANLALPDGFIAPAIGDAVLSVSEAKISGGWGQSNGWTWSMLVSKPTLVIGSNPPIVGADLNFSEKSTLEDLVKESAATFGPFFTNALGIFLMRTNTRVGLLSSATLGFLTDFSKFDIFKNSGLSWSGFTGLDLTSFADPLGLLRQQIAGNFSTPEKAKDQLSMLAWALSSEEKALSITGSGTLTDPYLCPFPAGFDLPVWYDSSTEVIGVGFGRNDSFSYPKVTPIIAVEVLSQLRIIEYNLKSGSVVSDGNTPSFNFQTIVSNPSGKLVDITLPDGTKGSLDKVILGFDLTIINGAIKFSPIVTLEQALLFGETTPEDITIEQFLDGTLTEKAKGSFQTLLNKAIQLAIDEVKGSQLFQNAYSVLGILGITIPVDFAKDENPLFGINSAGWTGLFSNPDTYIAQRLLDLIQSEENRKILIQVFESIFDVKIPTIPIAALELFHGLQIVGPASENYPLYPQAILEIVSDPINSLKNRFEVLFRDTDSLIALAKELTKTMAPEAFGKFEISSTASGVVTLALPKSNSIKIGDTSSDQSSPFVEVFGSLSLDFNNKNLTAELNSYVPVLGFTLSNSFTVGYDGASINLSPPLAALIWGDGKTPAAAPLQILPFDSTVFIDQIANIAPAYALNIFINSVFEDKFLNGDGVTKGYPIVQSIFEILGISKSDNGIWTMPSLLGIMEHPLDWLLSDEVLGTNGKFNVSKLVQKFAAFPTATYNPTADVNITIGPNTDKNGISITGLPYDFYVEMSGDSASNVAKFNFGSNKVDIANGTAELDDLNFCVNLSENYQTSFSGAAKLSTNKISEAFFAEVGFDKEFKLIITQGTPAAPKLSLQLLPFTGWGKLAAEAGTLAAAEVIETVVPKILEALQPKAPDFVNALTTFGTNVPVGDLLTSLIPIVTSGKSQAEILQELESTSLTWLKGLFNTPTQLAKTIAGVKAIFEAVPDVGTLTTEGGLIKFIPSDKIPISLYFGVDENNNLGLWAELTIPDIKYININVARTGIGVDLDTLSKLTFSFGFDVIIPLDGTNGPGLYLNYDPKEVFKLTFDPVGNAKNPSNHSDMSVELLPDFFGNLITDKITLGEAVTAWLLEVIKNVLPRYLSVLVLNNKTVLGWLTYDLFTPLTGVQVELTPLEILQVTTLVIPETGDPASTTYYMNTIDNIKKITPELFLGNFLKKLLEADIQIFKFDSGGGIYIGQNPNQKGAYGVRLAAPDFKIDALPNIVLQLGATDDTWIKDSWTKGKDNKVQPGIQFYVPIVTDPSVSINFKEFNIILENVGFDIVGEKGQPIVDLARFKLGAISPRTLFNIQFHESSDPTIIFGGSFTLGDMGISLAPDQLTTKSDDPNNPSAGNSSNPIASNILGAGSDAAGASKTNPPSNPTFSAQISYIDELSVGLSSTNGDGEEIIIPVQRAFGPLFVDSLGVGWNDKDTNNPILDFIFTGNIGLAGLNVSLIGLDIGIPVTNPTDFSAYSLDLAGLDVSYNGGGVSISGGLLKQVDPFLQYTGAAVLKASTFSIMALGSYAQVPDSDGKNVTSLFIFGALSMPLGGVPAFFITGVAAGFGYNRSIKIPAVEDIMDFPLVAGVLNGTLTDSNDPAAALSKLADIVAPEVGQYWLAAGLKFSSFELINTAAVLFVSFGKELEFNLLGLSYASLPPKMSKESALAYFELAIKLSFKPADGIISVQAQLTPNSFVLTKDCKLTGGFAFFLWYKNSVQVIDGKSVAIPSGQFVITLGGYHPQFVPPAYYPAVPRLGFQWIIDVSVGKVSITGGAYFAICPTAIMAGGYLSVLFEAGPLKAWLNAYANFLIEWKPFYFSVDIGVTVGASFGTTVGGVSVTLKAELGAKLHLEGPAINGFVEVDWYVISFTIPIGSRSTETTNAPLKGWNVFADNFLPPPQPVTESAVETRNKKSVLKAAEVTDTLLQQVIKWNAGSGLLTSNDNSDNKADALWIVNPMYYSFNVVSAIPSNQLTVVGTDYSKTGVPVGVRPMDYIENLGSPITITVVNNNDSKSTPIDLKGRGINLSTELNGAPSALWSKEGIVTNKIPSSDGMVIESVLMGLSLTANQYVSIGSVPEFPINRMTYTDGSTKLLPYYNQPNYPTPAKLNQDKVFTVIMNTIMDDTIILVRNSIYKALADLEIASSGDSDLVGLNSASIEAPLNPDLSVMSTSVNLVLQDFPILAPVDVYQNGGKSTLPKKYMAASVKSKAVKAEKYVPKQARIVGTLRRYQTGQKPSLLLEGLPNKQNYISSKWTNYSDTGDTVMLKSGYSLKKQMAGSVSKQLHQGGAVVWEVDSKITNVLKLKGNLSVIVFCFDPYFSLLEIKTIKKNETYLLPTNTAQVAIQSFLPSEHETIGWQKNSIFTKISPYWSMGDGCLLRVQNTKRITVNRKNDAHGVVDVNRLLSNNITVGSNDVVSQGWHQTILKTNDPYVGVLVDGLDVDVIKVSIKQNKIPSAYGESTPVRIEKLNNQTLLVFEGVKEKKDPAYLGIMIHSGDDKQRIAGVYSMSEPIETMSDVWNNLSLKYNAIDPENLSKIKSTKMSFTSKK